MPIVALSENPTFSKLAAEACEIISVEQAQSEDPRPLEIGIVNMMPDKALKPTERDFLRWLAFSGGALQLNVTMISVDGLEREGEFKEHVARYYSPFEEVRGRKFDALILTGANLLTDRLEDASFWGPLVEVIGWAQDSVVSVLCSCLATQVVMQAVYGKERTANLGPDGSPQKLWGVFPHEVVDRDHFLSRHTNTDFNVVHSRNFGVAEDDFLAAGCRVLVKSKEAGVHLAVSKDGLKFVFLQGHPEYTRRALLLEYKRELGRFFRGERENYPPIPANYVKDGGLVGLESYRQSLLRAKRTRGELPEFPVEEVLKHVGMSWKDSGHSLGHCWIASIYSEVKK